MVIIALFQLLLEIFLASVGRAFSFPALPDAEARCRRLVLLLRYWGMTVGFGGKLLRWRVHL